MPMYRTVVFLIFLCQVCADTDYENKIGYSLHKDIITNGGLVRGFRAEDGEYFAFLGIPYAAPPLGKLRFKAPSPPTPWEGTFYANRTTRCPQKGTGDEDCLIVNVFTPITANLESLPVLVYIHGGSFLLGRGQTSGVYPLIEHGLIVVTLNHRLGALGFLCLGNDEAPGNAGLKDQVLALKWVRDNVENFGGDKDKVTIYGMSSGAASVEYLVLSKMPEGLFRNAIIESASTGAVWTKDLKPIATAEELAADLNFTSKNTNELASFYQNVPASVLSSVNFNYYSDLIDGTFGFVPCVEDNLENVEPFITDYPQNILEKNSYRNVPILFMYSTIEGLFLRSREFYEQNYKERMQRNFEEFLPADLKFESEEVKSNVAKYIKRSYFGDELISEKTIMGYLNYFGDYMVLYGILNSAKSHAMNSNNSVYLMEFAYGGDLGTKEEFYENINAAGHGDIVKHAILNKEILSPEDKLAVDRVSTILANFVKYGNPTPQPTPLLDVLWPPFDPENATYLHLDRGLRILCDPYPDRMKVWDELYKNYRRPDISQAIKN